jgi:ribosomal protein S6--L-glutamate ligase
VSLLLRDKIITTRALQQAGLPTPKSYVASHPEQLHRLLEEGPLVIKPYRGSGGEGVRVVWDADELDTLSIGDQPVFAQRYHKPDGLDRKIYSIQGQVFGVVRTWPPRTYEEKVGEPFPITPELRDLALRCGEVFGIDLFGLDIIVSAGVPYIVDVSSFPGFKGVPDASLRLADYINWAADRVIAGDPLMAPVRKQASA